MKTVELDEAKTQLSELIESVQRGEDIAISKSGKVVAKLTAFTTPKKRELGFYPIEFKSDFSAASSQDVIDLFYGN